MKDDAELRIFLFFFLNIYCTPLNSVIHVRSLLQLVHMVRACPSGDAIKGCGFKFILIWRQKKKKSWKMRLQLTLNAIDEQNQMHENPVDSISTH